MIALYYRQSVIFSAYSYERSHHLYFPFIHSRIRPTIEQHKRLQGKGILGSGQIVKDVKMPTSRSYQTFLIDSLKNTEEAAGYIEVILAEGSDEPLLLRNALHNIVEASARMNKLSESAKQHHEKLDKMLAQSGGLETYTFVELLDALGFRVAVSEAMP